MYLHACQPNHVNKEVFLHSEIVVAETLARLLCIHACTRDLLCSCDHLETLGALGANNFNVSVLHPDQC